MADRIVLQGVSARGHHGVLTFEKRDGQTFVVDVTMTCDLERAGRTDDLAATVNYAEVAADVVARITGPSFDLIERLAEVIADDVLRHDLVDVVEVVVHKPEAPVGQPFTDVQVRLERRGGAAVVIALGSNLGDRGETLASAVASCAACPASPSPPCRRSSRPTRSAGRSSRPYLNAVAVGRSELPPDALLGELHRIEAARPRHRDPLGCKDARSRSHPVRHPGSSHEVVSDDDRLTLPHPRAAERAFVLAPWLDADPRATLRVAPGDGGIRPVAELLDAVSPDLDAAGVRPGPGWEQK